MPTAPKRIAWMGLILAGGCASPGGLPNRLNPDRQTVAVDASAPFLEATPAAVALESVRVEGSAAASEPVVGERSAARPQSSAIQPAAASVAKQVAYPLTAAERTAPNLAPGNRGQEPVVVDRAAELSIPPATVAPVGPYQLPVSPAIESPVPMNLPSVLAAIDGRHPIVGQARWRVQQAYAANEQAKVLWLPSIQAGFNFNRHDGNLQASNGTIDDVNRNSFQYGLGVGATGAGTTTRPGIVAQYHLADAIFLPKVTERTAWALGHAAHATLNDQLRDAASAYFDLVSAHQDLRIVEQSRHRFSELTDITVDFAEAGEGLQADADRLRTELALIESQLVGAEERAAVAAARLAQAISLNGSGTIVPTDVNAIPLDLTGPYTEKALLVATALQSRPELKESQALVAAACEAFRREKFAPFVPSVLLGFSTGGFGGGLGNDLESIDDRYDFDALLAWEVRNMGFGEKAARRERAARVQQARFEKLQVMDQVAREVSESHAQVEARRRQIEIARGAIQTAEDSYRRNLERIRDGEGLPLEVLQSAQALELAQRAYLRAVVDYNQAQILLQWALGFPVA